MSVSARELQIEITAQFRSSLLTQYLSLIDPERVPATTIE